MGNLHISPFPVFEPGERILTVRRYIRFSRVKSWPTYRWIFSLPLILDVGMYVTDRRILTKVYVFRVFNQEFSQWFDNGSLRHSEIVRETKVGKGLLGAYLEIVSENSGRVWFRSPRAYLRHYMGSPESVQQVLPVPNKARESC